MTGQYPGKLWEDLAAAYDKAEPSQFSSLLTDDVVADWSRSRGPYKGVYEGRESVLAFIADFLGAFEIESWEQTQHTPIDAHRMLITNVAQGRGRDSGAEVRATGASVYTVRGDKICRIEMFQSRKEALAELS